MVDTKTKKMLNAGESETVEFKLSFDREAIETLAAFANTGGGKVFIGVSDKGVIKGTDVGKETVQNWINHVKQDTSHAIIPDVETVTIKVWAPTKTQLSELQ
jgi:ATP-dependent DNA helicase RecG